MKNAFEYIFILIEKALENVFKFKYKTIKYNSVKNRKLNCLTTLLNIY